MLLVLCLLVKTQQKEKAAKAASISRIWKPQGAGALVFSPAIYNGLVPCRISLPSPGVKDGGVTLYTMDPGTI